jgi:hypothetical protein
MNKVAIIGAGASGLVAAVSAARKGASVILYEQRNAVGKKLLVTGNGKCNYMNTDQDGRHFHSRNPELAGQVLSGLPQKELLAFFEELGILPHSRNGYLYPMSGQAQGVQMALAEAAKALGVQMVCNGEIRRISAGAQGGFTVEGPAGANQRCTVDRVILATGTRAGSRMKENGGDALVKAFGHRLIPYTPALCGLRGDGVICRYWHGVRTQARLTLIVDGQEAAEDTGELMLTDYGISGIPAFQVSYLVPIALSEKKIVQAEVDWLPELSEEELYAFLETTGAHFPDRKLAALLYGIVPVKLADSLVLEAVKQDAAFKGCKGHALTWKGLSAEQKAALVRVLKQFALRITGVNDYEQAQVCAGGVPLTEIDTATCASKKQPGLYLTGELLDVNGDCGGYNLQWAFTTGILAGRAAAEE